MDQDKPGATKGETHTYPEMRSCDGAIFKRMIQAGLAWLENQMEYVNSLNVYPVPDGDTGTNMYLTMQAALREMSSVSEQSLSAVVRSVAHGALMGARGNSGVILSQIFRGMAKSLDGKDRCGAAEFAAALQEGAAIAYKGVIRPVEGTILTVAREAADAAVATAAKCSDLVYVLERTVAEAKQSLARTPLLLDVLREAGVVDAGGQGLVLIFEGALRALQGQTVSPAPQAVQAPQATVAPGRQYGYDVQFILKGENLDLEGIRDAISKMGESALVVGDQHTIKVHVHAEKPGAILDYAVRQGSISDVVVEDMQAQYEAYTAAQERVVTPAASLSDIAVVAVVNGPGFERIFESLGASRIVPGGPTMNPSTEQLLNAIEGLENEKVIVLPNNGNILLAAEQARQLSRKQTAVVPTKTIPQGISALLAFNYQADLEENLALMERAAQHIQTAEITRAVRAAQVNGLDIKEGQIIGLLNGVLTTASDELLAVVREMLRQMNAQDCEIITVYYGATTTPQEVEEVAAMIRELYPKQEVEILDGGQPYYDYIISVE